MIEFSSTPEYNFQPVQGALTVLFDKEKYIKFKIIFIGILDNLHCTVVEGGDKTYLVTFEYWFKFGLFEYILIEYKL